MLHLARIPILFILIASVWSQVVFEPNGPPLPPLPPPPRARFEFMAGEALRFPRFGIGFIPEQRPIEPPPRFGFGWAEAIREFYCRRFCEPPANSTYMQSVMCFVRCPDFVLQNATATPSTGSTQTASATTPSTTTTARAG